jgi:hypothetical protein
MLMKETGYVQGMPVKLNSCYTGNGSFPQELANALGVPVTSYTTAIHAYVFVNPFTGKAVELINWGRIVDRATFFL